MEIQSNISQPNDPHTEAREAVNRYFSVFHEEYDPVSNVGFHTQMCILDDQFKKIISFDESNLQKMFPQISPIVSLFFDVSSIFITQMEEDWDIAYFNILKFLEEKQYMGISELKAELAEAERIIGDILKDEQEEDEYNDEMDDEDDEGDDEDDGEECDGINVDSEGEQDMEN